MKTEALFDQLVSSLGAVTRMLAERVPQENSTVEQIAPSFLPDWTRFAAHFADDALLRPTEH